MQARERYTFNKSLRLKSRKVIEQLFGEGRSFANFPLRTVYLFKTGGTGSALEAAFTVSSKNFTKAVERNRIKRLMKEAFRLQKNPLLDELKLTNKQLAICFIYNGKEMPDYHIVSEKMKASLNRLYKIVNEDSIATS